MIEWISIKDRLPDDSAEYIVMISGAAIPTTLWFDGADWYEDLGCEIIYYEVAYWMPLPELPEDYIP